MRTKGSCQFDPYYKVERYDERIGAWRPIQKTFPSADLANHFALGYAKARIMRFSEKGVEIYQQ
tara:strand:- start:1422 stop:1613 length:192 start_codon:yes stop_codon:yes gene_type:complete